MTASRFRFDTYVVGSANRLAVGAARAVAEAPGAVYNPLFIHGPSGLGKTHLLAAIGSHARQLQPSLQVEYVGFDDFVEQFHASVSAGEMETFRRRWGAVDLLLLDDVQFLTGRRELQGELLRLFNALQGTGKQVVLSSDRPPQEISDVDERLVSRLAGGLIVDIGAPDYETRLAILRAATTERNVQVATDVLETIARLQLPNVRELHGALNRVVAEQSLAGRRVTSGEVWELAGSKGVPPEVEAPRRASDGTSLGGEYASFLSDIASAVAASVEPWKSRLAEAIAYWRGEGFRTGVLERAMQLGAAPDIDALLGTFTAAVEHMRQLERHAVTVDPLLGGNEVFRDPERIDDAEALVDRALAGDTPPPGPDPAFTRQGFESAGSNQLAARAADAVVAEPGARYNPLVIHGPSGTGKTHLLHAVGNALVVSGARRVACAGAQAFIEELVGALQDGSVDRWRARYRGVDALLLDDVHFFAGTERAQEELFHLFNELHGQGRQIVFTSNVAPKDLTGLEDRLRSRLEGGLVVSMQPPERTLREALYRRWLSGWGVTADDELLRYLGERPANTAREVQGTASRLREAAAQANVTLTLGFAMETLEPQRRASLAVPRASGGIDAFLLNEEKIVWDWPDVSGRVIEELR
ncbi:MAG: ATP-binding protein [Gemmatimonadetes bacterium]|nr:ATP-binding protein [Gemmatimonadota bacterium]